MGTRYINEENAELHEVHSFAIHEDYNKFIPFYADIALIFVKEPINFGARKKKALLASNDDWMKKTNNDIVAIGWGMTKYGGQISELGLLRTTLRYVARRECGKLHKLKLTDDMFCLYGDGRRDTCKGDSGGGIVWNRTVIGIVSHGEGCAKKDKPSVYISVSFHRKWIERTVTEFMKTYCN
ncbi:coagulation factor X-like [Melitaea cinxia]|uniref:coagulation factor X-like n=1 Tax=Melitaea cinxia TaxID=113334 RepID=UPI001E2709FF|nr:coagulation factor X-like [Melitaea cinxia]